MKLAISSVGNNLDSEVDKRYARCSYFIIYDTDRKDFEAVKNEAINAPSGAGVQSTQLMRDKGVEVVLTGNMGPTAMSVLTSAKIKVAIGVKGSVRDAIEKFNKGEYELTDQSNVGPRSGFGRV